MEELMKCFAEYVTFQADLMKNGLLQDDRILPPIVFEEIWVALHFTVKLRMHILRMCLWDTIGSPDGVLGHLYSRSRDGVLGHL